MQCAECRQRYVAFQYAYTEKGRHWRAHVWVLRRNTEELSRLDEALSETEAEIVKRAAGSYLDRWMAICHSSVPKKRLWEVLTDSGAAPYPSLTTFYKHAKRLGVAAKRRTLAIKTIRNHIGTMHSVFEVGLRKGWCQSNPVKLADRPVIKKTETRIQYLEQPEVEALLVTPYPADAFGSIEPTLYLTAAMTGLRQGELIRLRWRDVDFQARKVRVVSPYVRGEFADPKSVDSGRSVPMAERVAVALRELHERSLYSRERDLVFCHPESGRPLDRSKLVRRFKKALDRAGTHRITFHELRHTFGTRMAAAGTPLRTLQYWMGHSDSKTTQVYAHYQPSQQEADAVDRAFA